MGFPQKAYLECEDFGQGCFRDERILRFSTSKGKFVEGFFHNSNIKKDLGLKVTAIDEGGDSAQIVLPLQSETEGPGARADETYWVKREKVIYESDLENPS